MKLYPQFVLFLILFIALACAPVTPTPEPLSVFIDHAKPLLAERRYTEAAAVFEQAAQARPTDPAPLLRIGQIYLAQRRWRLAEDAFNRALARDLTNAEAMTGLAESLLNQNRLDEAQQWWQQAVTLKPDLPGVFTGLGRTYLWQFDFTAAQETFRQQQSHTFDPEAAWYLAALTAPVDLAAARDDLQAIPADVSPSLLARRDYLLTALAPYTAASPQAEVAKATGIALAQLGLWPGAIDALNTALAHTDPGLTDDEKATALAFLGHASAQAGRPAFNFFEQALKLDPKSSLPLYFEGLYLRRKGVLRTAGAAFEQAIILDPENPALYAELAETKAEQGNLGLAEVLYQAAGKVSKNDVVFQLLLLKFYAGRGYRVSEAGLPLAQTMLEANQNNAEVYDGLGWLQFLTGDAQGGEKSLRRALELDPNLISARYHLARLEESQGQFYPAKEDYQKVVDQDAAGNWRGQALKDLVRLGGK